MAVLMSSSDETSNLLTVRGYRPPSSSTIQRARGPPGTTSKQFVVRATILLAAVSLISRIPRQSSSSFTTTSFSSLSSIPLLGGIPVLSKSKTKKKSKTLSEIDWPDAFSRCDYVVDVMRNFAKGDDLDASFLAQSKDANTFYRATARLFWRDFGSNSYANQTTYWTENDFQRYWIEDLQIKGTNVSLKSLWTWTTGDQHLSNFGAWRNRHGDVVFAVNDFDEGAIYDFQIDVLRIAVSIANHAVTNGFRHNTAKNMIKRFAKAYVKSVISYIGNEDAYLYELTPKTAKGKLKKFLKDVDDDKSIKDMLEKFTEKVNGTRQFIKSYDGEANSETKLVSVDNKTAQAIRDSFTATKYGATRMKLGWNVRPWDDEYFHVMDVAARVGSGIGSFGVDRYYVLLQGKDSLLTGDADGSAVVLDVKYQPPGAVHDVLSHEDEAWYAHQFANDAARVVAAQSRLTSYTDPFLGWILLPGENGTERPFSIRQRSPWKSSIDIDKLKHEHDFEEYVEQIALATATAHVRGSVAKPPADFKHVVASVLGTKSIRKQWTRFLTGLAMSYRDQVLLDYQCFKDYVDSLDLVDSSDSSSSSD